MPGSDVTGGIAVLNNAVTCSLVKVTIGTSAVDASCIISSNVVTIDDSVFVALLHTPNQFTRQLLM